MEGLCGIGGRTEGKGLTISERNLIQFPINSVEKKKKSVFFNIAEVINAKHDMKKRRNLPPPPDTNSSDAKIKPLILTFTVLP